MTTESHVLTDVAGGVWLDRFTLPGPSDAPGGAHGWSVNKRTLRGGMSDGVDVIEVYNGALAFSILPTRGMGLWRGSFQGIDLGWSSPVPQPVHPGFVNLTERSGLGWLAGFNELMCRCGLSWHGEPGNDVIQDNMGNKIETPLTLHGKIANIPAHHVEVEILSDRPEPAGSRGDAQPGVIRVKGTVDEAMLFGPRLRLETAYETEAGSSQLTISDTITNLGGQPAEVEVLYHTNFGPPLLEAGSRFVAPVRDVAPNNARSAEGIPSWQVYDSPVAGYIEQCYLMELLGDPDGETAVLLRNRAADKGVSLHFNRRQLPHFTIWKNTQAETDGYVTGLEPGTSFPNHKSFERRQGRLITLAPGASIQTRIALAVHASAKAVSAVEEKIRALQGNITPTVHGGPIAKYTAGGH